MNDRIYLDHAATTPLDPRVLDAMNKVYTGIHGNASSLHADGIAAREAVEKNRQAIAIYMHVEPEEIVFTGSGTEADNIAIQGVAFKRKADGKHIITSNIEHPAVRNTCRYLRDQFGFSLSEIPVDREGIMDVEKLKQSITPETILVTVMAANNEIGTIQPIREIGEICADKGITFHTDAVQALGKIPLDPVKDGFHLLAASAHKIYGPKGTGLLYVKGGGTLLGDGRGQGKYIQPLIQGGGHEGGLRPATENVAGIAGIAKAIEIAFSTMDEEMHREATIRDHVIDRILQGIPRSVLNGHRTKRLPNNVNASFEGVEGESLLLRLDMAGFECSTGSACSSKNLKASHVLLAIGLEPEVAHGSLRITIGRSTTLEIADKFLSTLDGVVGTLRSFSPTWNEPTDRKKNGRSS